MKKIWPWLLLLLSLIIFCVWSKKDSIQVTSDVTPVKVIEHTTKTSQKRYINYIISQKDNGYLINGNFANAQQHTLINDTFKVNNAHLSIGTTSINSSLLGEKAITLTNTILPHFIENYTNGKIVYSKNSLQVYGDVTDSEIKREMQSLLNTSTLATQNNTKVIQKKPIHFSIIKSFEKVDFNGEFATKDQGDILRAKLPTTTSTQISQSTHLVDNGTIAFTESILPVFIEKYKNGMIAYKDEVLTISGMVETQKDLEEMNGLLVHNTLTIVNTTTIDQEALAKAAAEAERKAREEALQKKMEQEEKEKKVAEEKAKREAEKKSSQTQAATVAVKEKITKLLKIENIEFNVAKASLTFQGALTVDKLSAILSEYPNIKVEIAGHTDSDGSALFNQQLSQKRVDTVRARLIEKGIDANRLTARGYGESKPLVPNTNKVNKQKNRRVEINIQGE